METPTCVPESCLDRPGTGPTSAMKFVFEPPALSAGSRLTIQGLLTISSRLPLSICGNIRTTTKVGQSGKLCSSALEITPKVEPQDVGCRGCSSPAAVAVPKNHLAITQTNFTLGWAPQADDRHFDAVWPMVLSLWHWVVNSVGSRTECPYIAFAGLSEQRTIMGFKWLTLPPWRACARGYTKAQKLAVTERLTAAKTGSLLLVGTGLALLLKCVRRISRVGQDL
jgi:hypothetical protein